MSEAVTGNAKLFARIAELEAELEELVLEFNQCQKSIGRLTLELSKADCDARKQAEWIAEARELLASEAGEGWGPREIDEWVRRRDALLKGDMGIPTSEGVGNE